MKAVIQRVRSARVDVGEEKVSSIGPGILTLLAVCQGDSEGQLNKMIDKICGLRIFEDSQGKMNLSVKDVKGQHLVVSQFTIAGDCSKGRRPSFVNAADPELARSLYERAIELSQKSGVPTFGGRFQANMQVSLVNDGPVTFFFRSITKSIFRFIYLKLTNLFLLHRMGLCMTALRYMEACPRELGGHDGGKYENYFYTNECWIGDSGFMSWADYVCASAAHGSV